MGASLIIDDQYVRMVTQAVRVLRDCGLYCASKTRVACARRSDLALRLIGHVYLRLPPRPKKGQGHSDKTKLTLGAYFVVRCLCYASSTGNTHALPFGA